MGGGAFRRAVGVSVLAVTLVLGPAGAASADHGVIPEDGEFPPTLVIPDPGLQTQAYSDLFGWEPLGLVAGSDVRNYSVGTDRWAVWVCDLPTAGIGVTASNATAFLTNTVAPHYDWLSEGLYRMEFVNAGTVSGNSESECVNEVFDAAQPANANGAIIVADAQLGYGLGGPGAGCPGPCNPGKSTFPLNSRYVFMGGESVVQAGPWDAPIASLVTHEIGHGIHWPHSFSGTSSWEYDNPIDLMSGNSTTDLFSTETDSYSTLAFNRYAAGWIDPSDVVIHNGGTRELVVNAVGSGGVEMVVLPLGNQGNFVTLDARVTSDNDPLPTAWNGVAVHTIDQRSDPGCFTAIFDGCYGLDRRTIQNPAVADSVAHIIRAGTSRSVSGVQVTVVAREGSGYRIRLEGGASATSFNDTADSPFAADIEWLAATGITRGCNPPANDRFCPGDPVTRGQMAAFLVRALDLTDTGGLTFRDTGGSSFETDIARLANAGITRGCNPPANDRFCPDDPVTRGQMAAFLVRAFGLTDTGGLTFSDTGSTVFASDIARLANAGITRGCNPPANDRFCPSESVTRGQMAAFLHRAEGYLP